MNKLMLTYLALGRVKEFTADAVRKVLDKRNTLSDLIDAGLDELVACGLDIKVAVAVQNAELDFAEKELAELEKIGRKYNIPACVICYEDEAYPRLLKEIYDPPLFLYTLGNTACLNGVCIAVVGARKSSKNGEEISSVLGRDMAACGIVVVSGFAYGIDINAHIAASEKGATVAVLGSGFKNIYPKPHERYIKKICEEGCIISEFPLDEIPNAYNFPKRNRVVSGMCHGIIVVEASERSGSLITMRMALEQGRDVFAVPVSPLSKNNATNKLIQNGAILVQSYTDIVSEYFFLMKDQVTVDNSVKLELPPLQQKIFDIVSLNQATADEIAVELDIAYNEIASELVMMELDEIIKKGDDGKYYNKI